MKDELFDDELRGMVNFTDETTGAQKPVEAKKNFANKEHVKKKKIAQKSSNEPMDAEYEPVKTWYDEKVFNMVKWFVLFMSLEYMVFYWQQTGKMDSSVAVPSMIVCALLAGISVGKNWKWRS